MTTPHLRLKHPACEQSRKRLRLPDRTLQKHSRLIIMFEGQSTHKRRQRARRSVSREITTRLGVTVGYVRTPSRATSLSLITSSTCILMVLLRTALRPATMSMIATLRWAVRFLRIWMTCGLICDRSTLSILQYSARAGRVKQRWAVLDRRTCLPAYPIASDRHGF
jgi:hypothetical protein